VGLWVIPHVPDARTTVEIANGGRFHIELSEVGQSRQQNDSGVSLVDPPFQTLGEPPAVQEIFGQLEGPFRSQNGFSHVFFLS
jgi:hypothetical protein